MVRVNYQCGGGGRLSETAKESQTVRILKPPGGGSSISFDDEPVKKTSPAKSEPKVPEEVTKVESEKEISSEDASIETSAAVTPVQETSPPKETPAEKTNGTVSNGSSSPVASPTVDISFEKMSLVVDDPEPIDTIESSPEPKTNGVEEHSPSTPDPDTPVIQNDTPVIQNDTPVIQNDTPVILNDTPVIQNDTPVIQKDTPKPCLTPLTIQPAKSPISSPIASPTSSNGDSKSFVSNGDSSPQAETPNRKVKDRMRSNIFAASTQDFTPTRSSKLNVQVVTPETTVPSNAGQRGRVPPGGFSSKLW